MHADGCIKILIPSDTKASGEGLRSKLLELLVSPMCSQHSHYIGKLYRYYFLLPVIDIIIF